jgi:hypothetical protein
MTSASNQSPRHSASSYYQIQGVHSYRHIQRRGYKVRATKGTVVSEMKTNNVLTNYSTGRNRGVRIYRYYVPHVVTIVIPGSALTSNSQLSKVEGTHPSHERSNFS